MIDRSTCSQVLVAVGSLPPSETRSIERLPRAVEVAAVLIVADG